MSASRLNENPPHPVEHLLRWAFVVSILAHVFLYGGYQLGNRYGWWKKDLVPAWFKHRETLAQIKKEALHPASPPQEVPLMFVDVDPSTAEPPKDAKYYSAHNSQAANPDITVDNNTPKIDGSQTHVAKTQSTPRAKPMPLQPAPPKTQQSPEETAEAKPKPKGGPTPGDLAMAKSAPQPGDGQAENDTGEAETPVHVRPRTLVAAQAQKALIPGEKMKQDGGVKRLDVDSTLGALATPFGEYDREIVEAIRRQWYNKIDEFARDQTGRVVVEFNLHSNGRISELVVVDSNVGDLLTTVCKLAISEPAPFAPWPPEMLHYFRSDVRNVRFTFYYE